MSNDERDTEPGRESLTIGEVAKLAGVSIRTLRHYDRIGLLGPAARSPAGYRLYSREDLERLQQVLFFRELGFSLGHIRRLMAEPSADRQARLQAQRDLLAGRIRRLQEMSALIDRTIASMARGESMSPTEMFEGVDFGGFDPSEYEDEVKERWGGTDAYKESARRTKGYKKEDWERFKAESQAGNAEVIRLMDEGVAPTDERAMDAVDGLRLQIDKWFYPCSREMHAALGRMYVSDPRFTATYEAMRPGMAQWLCDATQANAGRRPA